MSNKSNEERLKILQERLNQIHEKNNSTEKEHPEEAQEEQEHVQQSNETLVEEPVQEKPKKRKLPLLLLIGALIFILFYIYNNSEISFEISTDNITEEIKEEQVIEEKIPIVYNLNFGQAKYLILVDSFSDENTAKALVNDKKVNGYASGYFFLPESSNSNEELYQVYIGPFMNIEEANQWGNTLKEDFTTISL